MMPCVVIYKSPFLSLFYLGFDITGGNGARIFRPNMMIFDFFISACTRNACACTRNACVGKSKQFFF